MMAVLGVFSCSYISARGLELRVAPRVIFLFNIFPFILFLYHVVLTTFDTASTGSFGAKKLIISYLWIMPAKPSSE